MSVASQDEQLEKAVESLEYSLLQVRLNQLLAESKKQRIAVLTGNGELQDIYQYSFLREVARKI